MGVVWKMKQAENDYNLDPHLGCLDQWLVAVTRTFLIRKGILGTWGSEYVWPRFPYVAAIWLDIYSSRLHILTLRNKGQQSCSLVLNNLQRFTFQCSLVLHFSHNLLPFSLLPYLPFPPPWFLLMESRDHSPFWEVGRREKEGENHRDIIRGDLLIFHKFIPSSLFILFMFYKSYIVSTMKSPKHPEGNLMFFMIWQRK